MSQFVVSSEQSRDALLQVQRRTVRVFWSSPFGGLEEERELLTKQYWPRLAHRCQKAGYEYVPVDMRWGITKDHSTQAQTIAICLRELDRSDMIVGFFGQRYGWHGSADQLLQRTIDYAVPSYPFINNHRDKSVTELEFLHGHLNQPGGRAASFFFRDKAYDDQKLQEFETTGVETSAWKFRSTSDGPNASVFLSDLKQRVLDSEKTCRVVHPNYSTPSEGARLMYESVSQFLEEFLGLQKVLSEVDAERLEHHAFLLQKLGMGGVYVGGERYIEEVNRHILEDKHDYMEKQLVVVGDSGSGKTCLLGNWLISHQERCPDDIVAYHVVGCSSSSTNVLEILRRLCNDIEDTLFNIDNQTSSSPEQNHTYTTNGMQDIRKVKQTLEVLVTKATKKNRRVVIMIDAINMIEKTGKTMKTLYWLPNFPPNTAHLVLSTITSDQDNMRELDERGFNQLQMQPLGEQMKSEITKAMLIVRGKELSTDQHRLVVSCQQTANPLFLTILLKELCQFGSFFELDDYIDSLVASQSVTEVFVKFLQRLEKDFQSVGESSLVQDVMCCLAVARRGLSEGEIQRMLKVSGRIWSTLYFAMNEFVVERSGLYMFAYPELVNAIQQYFCSTSSSENHYRNIISDYFYKIFEALSPQYDVRIPDRVIDELPWLLWKTESYDKLQSCLLNLAMFKTMYRDQHKYDLIEYWHSTKKEGHEIQQLYMTSLDKQVALLYTQDMSNTSVIRPSPGQRLVDVAVSIGHFLDEAGHRSILKPILQRAINMFGVQDETAILSAHMDVAEKYCDLYNQLACFYADTDQFDEALAVHERILAIKETFDQSQWMSSTAVTLNNIGFVHLKCINLNKALDYFKKALVLHKQQANGDEKHEIIAESMNNIGSVLVMMNQYKESVKILDRSLEIYEEIFFDSLPSNVGGTLLNLAKCYVRDPSKTQAEVEATYQRALTIRENAYGTNHPEVAQVLTTYGAYMTRCQQTDKALSMYMKALDIYKVAYGPEASDTAMVLENIALSYVIKDCYEQALPYYNEAGEALHKLGLVDRSLESLNTSILSYLVQSGRTKEAHHILERIIAADFATEDMFVTLDQLDENLFDVDARPQRPFEHTLDYGLQKYPSSMRLLGRKIVLLSRSGNVDSMLDLIRQNPDGKDPQLYAYVYKMFVDNDHRQEGQAIIIEAGELFSQDVVILENLAKCHCYYKRYPEAVGIMQRILHICPEDVDFLILAANIVAMNGQLEECKDKLHTAQLIATRNEDQANIDKVVDILKNLSL